MPAAVPDGMRLELSWSKIVTCQEEEAALLMSMLNELYDERVARLGAKRAAFGVAFSTVRATAPCGSISWPSWGLEEADWIDPDSSDLDHGHADYGMRVKMRCWEELQPCSC